MFKSQTLENASRRLDQMREIDKLMVPINIKNFNQQNLAKLKFSLFKGWIWRQYRFFFLEALFHCILILYKLDDEKLHPFCTQSQNEKIKEWVT